MARLTSVIPASPVFIVPARSMECMFFAEESNKTFDSTSLCSECAVLPRALRFNLNGNDHTFPEADSPAQIPLV